MSSEVRETIVAFLREIGIGIEVAALPDATFLPGVRLRNGGLLYDPDRLTWPGDLLHEAGHIAVTPASRRARLSDALAEHEEDADGGELEATAWAYAAIVHLQLAPEVLFHAGGYHGQSAGLIQTYALGVYPGCRGLVENGMTLAGEAARERGVAPYPCMLRWLRD